MQRVLKCDGVIVEKRNAENQPEDISADDICEIKAYVDEHRDTSTPFEIVVNGKTSDIDRHQAEEKLSALSEAGATWWIEGLWEFNEETVMEYIRRGPPLSK